MILMVGSGRLRVGWGRCGKQYQKSIKNRVVVAPVKIHLSLLHAPALERKKRKKVNDQFARKPRDKRRLIHNR